MNIGLTAYEKANWNQGSKTEMMLTKTFLPKKFKPPALILKKDV